LNCHFYYLRISDAHVFKIVRETENASYREHQNSRYFEPRKRIWWQLIKLYVCFVQIKYFVRGKDGGFLVHSGPRAAPVKVIRYITVQARRIYSQVQVTVAVSSLLLSELS